MGNLKSYITKFVMIIQIHRYYIDSHLVVKNCHYTVLSKYMRAQLVTYNDSIISKAGLVVF